MDASRWFDSPWEWLGWIGLACFFARFLLQWIASERAGESLAPRSFWWISVGGAVLLIFYSIHRREPIFLVGYLVTLSIYLRNLWIDQDGSSRLGPLPATALAVAAWLVLVTVGLDGLRPGYGDSRLWLAVGAGGQAIWSSRFIVQWYLSEREGHSHFPSTFWWISLMGNASLLSYALHVGDPIWIAGLALGPVVQVRNLMILARSPA